MDPTVEPTLWMLFSCLHLQKNCFLIKATGKVIVESSNCLCSAWKYMNLAKEWSLSRWIQPTNLSFSGFQRRSEEEIRRMKEGKLLWFSQLECLSRSFNFASKPLLQIYGLQFILPVSFHSDFLKLCLWPQSMRES
jgi:hypothetical protein